MFKTAQTPKASSSIYKTWQPARFHRELSSIDTFHWLAKLLKKSHVTILTCNIFDLLLRLLHINDTMHIMILVYNVANWCLVSHSSQSTPLNSPLPVWKTGEESGVERLTNLFRIYTVKHRLSGLFLNPAFSENAGNLMRRELKYAHLSYLLFWWPGQKMPEIGWCRLLCETAIMCVGIRCFTVL